MSCFKCEYKFQVPFTFYSFVAFNWSLEISRCVFITFSCYCIYSCCTIIIFLVFSPRRIIPSINWPALCFPFCWSLLHLLNVTSSTFVINNINRHMSIYFNFFLQLCSAIFWLSLRVCHQCTKANGLPWSFIDRSCAWSIN